MATYFINTLGEMERELGKTKTKSRIRERLWLCIENRDDLTIRFIRGIIFRSREVERIAQNKPRQERRVQD